MEFICPGKVLVAPDVSFNQFAETKFCINDSQKKHLPLDVIVFKSRINEPFADGNEQKFIEKTSFVSGINFTPIVNTWLPR